MTYLILRTAYIVEQVDYKKQLIGFNVISVFTGCIKCVYQKQKATAVIIIICKLCDSFDENSEKAKSQDTVSDNKALQLRGACKNFLQQISNIDEIFRNNLEVKTREQRLSDVWLSERKKRPTASNFGRICKAQNDITKANIAKDLLLQKNISNISAVKHGIDMEAQAIRTYLHETNCAYKKCGLILHLQYPFFAASPDGLLNGDGVLEVKCPVKAKLHRILEVNLNYLDSNGKLKTGHNYYYQIQGLLEITDRRWCDFVVYSPLEMRVERIYRDKKNGFICFFIFQTYQCLRLCFLIMIVNGRHASQLRQLKTD